ncbi:hypothetical protein HYPSUDRAFT_407052 [Hypholoma sublateritium FD-334 SS-4]|uniref:Uncharacterized protein n=1 Tax=Hypholoma sublateritium (strain FD-334 SS-4) TaxID=945553 RepID=A0A0D2MNR5_HYPSF|nr:hypothetical protein HYPSUDRAFT_407052 [Hypholoma sublateritium FD-334 SS-4]
MSFFGLKLDLGPSFGAYLVGTLVTNVLLGATCVQTYIYLREYEDRLPVKGAVLALLVLELVHAALSMHVVYHYLINNYANPLGLLTDVWSVNVSIMRCVCVVAI